MEDSPTIHRFTQQSCSWTVGGSGREPRPAQGEHAAPCNAGWDSNPSTWCINSLSLVWFLSPSGLHLWFREVFYRITPSRHASLTKIIHKSSAGGRLVALWTQNDPLTTADGWKILNEADKSLSRRTCSSSGLRPLTSWWCRWSAHSENNWNVPAEANSFWFRRH